MITIFCQRDKHVVTVSSNQSKNTLLCFQEKYKHGLCENAKKKNREIMVENCSSWNARLIRISETFNEAENASLHVWKFLKDCDSTKYFESKWRFLGKKTIFSVRSRDI